MKRFDLKLVKPVAVQMKDWNNGNVYSIPIRQKINGFFQYYDQLKSRYNYKDECILNLDETPVYFENHHKSRPASTQNQFNTQQDLPKGLNVYSSLEELNPSTTPCIAPDAQSSLLNLRSFLYQTLLLIKCNLLWLNPPPLILLSFILLHQRILKSRILIRQRL